MAHDAKDHDREAFVAKVLGRKNYLESLGFDCDEDNDCWVLKDDGSVRIPSELVVTNDELAWEDTIQYAREISTSWHVEKLQPSARRRDRIRLLKLTRAIREIHPEDMETPDGQHFANVIMFDVYITGDKSYDATRRMVELRDPADAVQDLSGGSHAA